VWRIPALDGVRGLAILIVVVHNASWILDASDQSLLKLLGAVTASGWIGVQLFFVLSGYLITGILLQTRGSAGYFRGFYVRRALRIFPLYYAFLAVVLWLFPLVADPTWTPIARREQIWYWTYMSNWASPFGHWIPGLTHFWSLAVEEQFYLFWPLLVYLLSRRDLLRLCVIVIAAGPLIRLLLHVAGLPSGAGYTFTVARWDALAAGALLSLLALEGRSRVGEILRTKSIAVLAITSLLVLGVLRRGFHEDDLAIQIFGQSASILLFGWLVAVAVSPSGSIEYRLRDALTHPWLRTLGKYSYAIYVVHFPVHIVASRYVQEVVNGPDDAWRLLRWASYVGAVGIASLVLAIGSWHLLEKHFLQLKDRWAPRPSSSQAPQLPQAAN